MLRTQLRFTRTDPRCPYTTLVRSRRIHPIAASVTAEQHNLGEAGALAAPGRIFGGLPKPVEQDLDEAFKLALLGGRKMIDVGSHQTLSSAEMAARQPDLPRLKDRKSTRLNSSH